MFQVACAGAEQSKDSLFFAGTSPGAPTAAACWQHTWCLRGTLWLQPPTAAADDASAPLLLQQEWTEIPRDRLERTFHTNIIAMMSLAQKAVKHMPKGGSIINISSVQAYGELGGGMPGVVGCFCKSCSKGVNAVWGYGLLLQELQQGRRCCVALHLHARELWVDHLAKPQVQGLCGANVMWQVTLHMQLFRSLSVSTQSSAAARLVCCPSLPCYSYQHDCKEVCAAALLIA